MTEWSYTVQNSLDKEKVEIGAGTNHVHIKVCEYTRSAHNALDEGELLQLIAALYRAGKGMGWAMSPEDFRLAAAKLPPLPEKPA